jgi:hypothetical protein
MRFRVWRVGRELPDLQRLARSLALSYAFPRNSLWPLSFTSKMSPMISTKRSAKRARRRSRSIEAEVIHLLEWKVPSESMQSYRRKAYTVARTPPPPFALQRRNDPR